MFSVREELEFALTGICFSTVILYLVVMFTACVELVLRTP